MLFFDLSILLNMLTGEIIPTLNIVSSVLQMLYCHCSLYSQVHKWPFHQDPRKPRRWRREKQKERVERGNRGRKWSHLAFSSRLPFCASRSGMVTPVTSVPCAEKNLLALPSQSVSQAHTQTLHKSLTLSTSLLSSSNLLPHAMTALSDLCLGTH